MEQQQLVTGRSCPKSCSLALLQLQFQGKRCSSAEDTWAGLAGLGASVTPSLCGERSHFLCSCQRAAADSRAQMLLLSRYLVFQHELLSWLCFILFDSLAAPTRGRLP